MGRVLFLVFFGCCRIYVFVVGGLRVLSFVGCMFKVVFGCSGWGVGCVSSVVCFFRFLRRGRRLG